MQLMHNFVVTINLDNDAFNGKGAESEIIRLLKEATDKFERGISSGKLLDINGNTCGKFGLTP